MLDEPENLLAPTLFGRPIFKNGLRFDYKQFSIKPFLLIFCEQEILAQLLFLAVVRSDDNSNEKVKDENGACDDERDEEPKG